jgi:acyl carrier protein
MLTQPFTLNALQEILTEYAGLPADELPDDLDTPFVDVGLDSLAIVAIQHGVEQRCGIEVPDADAHRMASAASVLGYVNERLALPAA